MIAEKGPEIVVKESNSLSYALKYSHGFCCVSGKAVCLFKPWSALDQWVCDCCSSESAGETRHGHPRPLQRLAGTFLAV